MSLASLHHSTSASKHGGEEDPNQHFVRALHACKRAGDFEALCAQLGAERLATLQQVAVEVEQQASQALV